jgi:hypothetical protein
MLGEYRGEAPAALLPTFLVGSLGEIGPQPDARQTQLVQQQPDASGTNDARLPPPPDWRSRRRHTLPPRVRRTC